MSMTVNQLAELTKTTINSRKKADMLDQASTVSPLFDFIRPLFKSHDGTGNFFEITAQLAKKSGPQAAANTGTGEFTPSGFAHLNKQATFTFGELYVEDYTVPYELAEANKGKDQIIDLLNQQKDASISAFVEWFEDQLTTATTPTGGTDSAAPLSLVDMCNPEIESVGTITDENWLPFGVDAAGATNILSVWEDAELELAEIPGALNSGQWFVGKNAWKSWRNYLGDKAVIQSVSSNGTTKVGWKSIEVVGTGLITYVPKLANDVAIYVVAADLVPRYQTDQFMKALDPKDQPPATPGNVTLSKIVPIVTKAVLACQQRRRFGMIKNIGVITPAERVLVVNDSSTPVYTDELA
jgi:hypothetical protein